MIRLLHGDNTYQRSRALAAHIAKQGGEVEKFDGADMTTASLVDAISGQSLFSSDRLAVVRDLSENSSLWGELPSLLERLGSSADLVLVEDKPDKRTATYKWLKKNVQVEEFALWTPHDSRLAEEWVREEAKRQNFELTNAQARLLVQRVGLNQWQLHHALQKAALLRSMTDDEIISITESRSEEDVFQLFETALRGDEARLVQMLEGLERTEDAYRVFGLLTSQIIQLAALALGRDRNVAGDIGASPYALSRLSPHAARMPQSKVRAIMKAAATTDKRLKSTPANPWHLVTHLLLQVARA